MKFESSTALFVLLGVASARPDAARSVPRATINSAKFRREVPQEHSHEKFITSVTASLNLNNVDKVGDAVFGLLGAKAAAAGAGLVTNLDCLQQRIADQAFTNAKAAGDVAAQADALIYRALEKNTGSVGLVSVLCTDAAKNPEIAALQQHQDPASSGAAALNKKIALELAVQLASIGADPTLALESGTFAPGKLGDNTGKGESCDDITTNGCIFDSNLLVEDASTDEIKAAVAAGSSSGSAAGAAAGSCDTAAAANDTAADVAATPTTAGSNVNTFTGAVGSAPVPVVSSTGDRPFSVNGATFVNLGAAIQRACAVQNNACANAANSGGGGSVAACNAQESACNSATPAKMRRAALDTGSCGSPEIEFGAGFDGRKENSFAPVNTADFNHGSALKPAVITSFICGQLASKCKADQATVDACNEGAAAANAASGQAAVDAFNAALGV